MPTSVRGACSFRRLQGFTLIEILVVLCLVGIAALTIAANLEPSDKQRVDTEAKRLAALLSAAADEARTTGFDVAWTTDGENYSFWRKDDSGWRQGDNIFRTRALPAGVVLQKMLIDGKPAIEHRLVFKSSGLNSPFDIVLGKSATFAGIHGDPMNRVEVDE